MSKFNMSELASAIQFVTYLRVGLRSDTVQCCNDDMTCDDK